jgi:N-methylhydantoinase B
VEFRLVPGLLNCADYPAAVSPSGAFTTEMQLNAAGIAVAKMLASGGEASRRMILGPCIPHFYSTIAAGLDASEQPFVFPNTDRMMGSLGGTPVRDGVDTGGHFWIPDGIASNVEDLEAQYPLLMLYRRMLPGGADGAGRHRGGVGFVEATMAHNATSYLSLIHTNEGFPKGAGLAGANPGSLATYRHVRDTDARAQFVAGHVPGSLEDIIGNEVHTRFKGAPIEVGPDDVWEFSSPATGGYGDPIRRDPEAVLEDHLNLLITTDAAQRVYGVVIVDSQVDPVATDKARRAIRSERLGGASPAEEVAPPAHAHSVAEMLHVVDDRWWCNGADLGPVAGSYKDHCITRRRPTRQIAPEFEATDHEMADLFEFAEYICPVSGYRIDTEIVRASEPALHDLSLLGATTVPG